MLVLRFKLVIVTHKLSSSLDNINKLLAYTNITCIKKTTLFFSLHFVNNKSLIYNEYLFGTLCIQDPNPKNQDTELDSVFVDPTHL